MPTEHTIAACMVHSVFITGKSTLPNDDLISMNTCNSQYMETHSFEPPRRFYEVETVVNPIAETPDDHVYNDPFGINGARACEVPNLLVNNVHYVSHVREPTSPHYHDPDDVLSGIAVRLLLHTVEELYFNPLK